MDYEDKLPLLPEEEEQEESRIGDDDEWRREEEETSFGGDPYETPRQDINVLSQEITRQKIDQFLNKLGIQRDKGVNLDRF